MEWLPYPKNVPLNDGEYLVSMGSYVTISQFNMYTKLYNEFDEKYYGPAWHDLQAGGMHEGIVAFMEKPLPFGDA